MILIVLALPNLPPRTIAQLETDDPWDAAATVSRRYPFLPPAYVWVGDRALAGLLAPPVRPSGALTPGQRAHRERLDRARRAERWRQHWIDKDDAKRRAAARA